MKDVRGYANAYLRAYSEVAAKGWYGFLAGATALAKGVEIGDDCRFFGRTIFRRVVGSTLRIGDSCTFRSARWSNAVGIDRPCQLSAIGYGARLIIGSSSGFSGAVITARNEVIIGDHCLFGANVTVTDTDWHGLDPEQRLTPGETAPVIIEDNVWLGLGVIVLKGVTIGRDSVVGAGGIVTKSIPPRSVAAGRPAEVVRTL